MGTTAEFIETKNVLQNGPYTMRGTIRDFNGNMYATSDVRSISVTVLERDLYDPDAMNVVTGYNALAVDASAIDERSGTDAEGNEVIYNFEYDLPTGTTPAFTKRGWRYIVHIEITPIVGRPTVIEAEVLTLP